MTKQTKEERRAKDKAKFKQSYKPRSERHPEQQRKFLRK